MAREIQCLWWELPSMDPCLCGYRFHSNEEADQGLVEKVWLVKQADVLFFLFRAYKVLQVVASFV